MPNPEEVQLMKQARLFKDLVDTPGWQELVKVAEAQVKAREALVLAPMHEVNGSIPGETDLASKAAARECLKGAIIGIRTIIGTPQATIESVADMQRESSQGSKT